MDFTMALAGALPALFAMWYVDRVDSKRPEPRNVLRKVAIAGGLSTIPCIILQLAIHKFGPAEGSVGGAVFTAYVSAGTTEECAKAACLLLVVWRNPAFNERMDGIVYATRAGLGFALVENVGYLLGAQSPGGYVGMYVARAVLAVPGHAIYAGMMGYFAARKRFDGKGPGMIGGLLLAIFLHGTYDAALFLLPHVPKDQAILVLPLLGTPLVVVAIGFFLLRQMAKAAIIADDAAGVAVPPPPGVVLRSPVLISAPARPPVPYYGPFTLR